MKTKIIATLGPASDSETVLRKMYIKGLNVARLNFSHGSHTEHIRRIRLIRRLNRKMNRAIKIMQDLEGYRIRIGRLKGEVLLRKNATLYLTQENIIGDAREISFDYAGPLKIIKSGSLIYIDDGRILLKVIRREKRRLKTCVMTGGILKERKGINIIDVNLPFEALTQKDRRDLKVAVKYGFDYVAQSFVRNAGDIRLLKSILRNRPTECKIFAKVESRQALRNIDEIIREADGIIIAADLDSKFEDETVGALSASIVSSVGKAMERLKNESAKQITVEAEYGKLFLTDAGVGILTVITEKDVNIGLVRLEIKNAVSKISGQ